MKERKLSKRRKVGRQDKNSSKSSSIQNDQSADWDGTQTAEMHTKMGCVLIFIGAIGLGVACVVVFAFIDHFSLDEEDASREQDETTTTPTTSEPDVDFDVLSSLTSSAFNLSRIFTEQDITSWNSIVQSIIYMNEPDQQQPAVLLWIPLHNATTTLQCIASRVFRACFQNHSVEKKGIIDCSSLASIQSQQAKQTLDQRLEAVLGDSFASVPATLLTNIDLLPPAASTLFHKYCDREWAWRPKSIIMLTLSEEIPDADITHVYELLHNRWISETDSINEAQVDAVLSRILEWPIFVTREDDTVLEKNCRQY